MTKTVKKITFYMTTSVTQRLAMWTLDEEVSVSIPGRTNLERKFFKIGSGLDVLRLCPGVNFVALVLIV